MKPTRRSNKFLTYFQKHDNKLDIRSSIKTITENQKYIKSKKKNDILSNRNIKLLNDNDLKNHDILDKSTDIKYIMKDNKIQKKCNNYLDSQVSKDMNIYDIKSLLNVKNSSTNVISSIKSIDIKNLKSYLNQNFILNKNQTINKNRKKKRSSIVFNFRNSNLKSQRDNINSVNKIKSNIINNKKNFNFEQLNKNNTNLTKMIEIKNNIKNKIFDTFLNKNFN